MHYTADRLGSHARWNLCNVSRTVNSESILKFRFFFFLYCFESFKVSIIILIDPRSLILPSARCGRILLKSITGAVDRASFLTPSLFFLFPAEWMLYILKRPYSQCAAPLGLHLSLHFQSNVIMWNAVGGCNLNSAGQVWAQFDGVYDWETSRLLLLRICKRRAMRRLEIRARWVVFLFTHF